MNIDDLAYELRNLSAVDRERLFERMDHRDRRGLFEVACWEDFAELQDHRDSEGWWRAEAERYENKILDLEDQVADLEDENSKLSAEIEARKSVDA